MIFERTEYANSLNNEQKDIISINLEVGLVNVCLDADDIGMFKLSGIREEFGKSLDTIYHCMYAGYMLIEIHRSQVGEIELLYDKHEHINTVTIYYNDKPSDTFKLAKCTDARVTSKGDLRLQFGQIEGDLENWSNSFIKNEYSPNIIFGRNWTNDKKYLIVENNSNIDLGSGFGAIDHIEIIEDNKDKLKDILGEILNSCGKKKISKAKLIILASIVDIEYEKACLENLGIIKHTILYEDGDVCNFRIEQFNSQSYAGRRTENTNLKEIIQRVCDEYKNTKLDKLKDILDELMFPDEDIDYSEEIEDNTIYYSESEEEEKEELNKEEIDQLLNDIDKMFDEEMDFDNLDEEEAAEDYMDAPFD